MHEEYFEQAKRAILEHIQEMFEEMEKEIAMSHQEKYALLEDLLENAAHEDELRVAFEQWYKDHEEDIDFEQSMDELWGQAIARIEE
ncbi:MAG: hypothetical protein GW939_03765 [Candidatus Magasanikbacteria bacterium]|uniref:Uncharacterized protein n=1 Tax=Candidatus Magasanikbacteria bacterium CG10_big_fil_rev_8_21_14_0_10_38_6 TaxID=1974647 RepID=A0A2M6P1E0_9BACT|nr:hypothetical protein [Candidatus Magasanikbacteria bacterium]NCS71799.1 hypothetical protein [Candidatus Magasanikbacteria bacterium]PIR77553.1 MAG: hypothetical protein COU30_01800 [Candidatus Magasanikbacteria bacterium CG10_big_fil_rev_8_21_14_0_10_38_6]